MSSTHHDKGRKYFPKIALLRWEISVGEGEISLALQEKSLQYATTSREMSKFAETTID